MTRDDEERRDASEGDRQALLDRLLGRTGEARIPRRTDPRARLSFAQERLWFLDRLAPGNPFYNCDITIPIPGAIDADALERALERLAQRHDQLRASFVESDGQPHQSIAPTAAVPIERVDLRRSPPTDRAGEAERLIAERARTPFDLGSGPLVRATLITLDDVDHVLLLVIHHIVCDGWSIGVITRELWACYEAEMRGVEPDLAPLPIEYADFAAWQRGWMSGARLEDELGHWEARLSGMRELQLPTDLLRPDVASYRGAFIPVRLPPHVTHRVRALAAEEGATTFMVLLAAFVWVLGRLGGTEDVVVGAPVANRDRPELEGIVGFFVNTLILRTSTSGEPSLRELVRRVRDVTLEASVHQDLPFDQLVHHLRPDRDLARNPIVQVVAQHFQVAPTTATAPSGAPRRDEGGGALAPVERGTSKFDLRLDTWDAAEGIVGQFEYSTDIVLRDTAERWLALWIAVLDGGLDDPDAPLDDLQLLDPAALELVVAAGTGPVVPYGTGGGVARLVERQAAQRLEAPAIVEGSRALTFGDLIDRAASTHLDLLDAGMVPGDLVGVGLDRGIELVVAELGVLRAGGAYLPLDPAYPDDRLRLMLADAAPRVVITAEAHRERFGALGVPLLTVDPSGRRARRHPGTQARLPSVERQPDDPAYAMYTSGSTGTPKGILVPHRGICRLVTDPGDFAVRPDDVVAFASNVSFDASTYEVWGALTAGARLEVIDHATLLSPDRLVDSIRSSGITVLFLTTSLFDATLAARPDAFRDLRVLVTGGSAFTPAHADRLFEAGGPDTFIHAYGPTENSAFSTTATLRSAPRDRRLVPIGRPLANSTARVLDERLRLVPAGVPGELWVGGDGVALGYIGRPDLTAARFVPDPWSVRAGAMMYRTGDRVRSRPDGQLEFLGRIDRQVKVRGFRIELAEVEAAVAAHPLVEQVVVDARRYPTGDPRLVAYVRPRPEGEAGGRDAAGTVVDHWHEYYDRVLYSDRPAEDPTFDIAGWVSSLTNEPLDPRIMREQVDATVARILRGGPRRVLEIGCGLGLLAFRLAPYVDHYAGTDFSEAAVEHVRAHLDSLGPASGRIELACAAADDEEAIRRMGGDFDVVVLNSVVQYFPSREYLERVIGCALQATSPGGRVFIGDVRALPLLRTFHLAVAHHHAPDDLTVDVLQRRATTGLELDHELVVAPELFARWLDRGAASQVTVEQKRGRAASELTQYRCDVTLHTPAGRQDASRRAAVPPDRWTPPVEEPNAFLDQLERHLVSHHPASVWVGDVPNARLAADRALAAALREAAPGALVGDVRRALMPVTGVDPEDVWELAERLGYRATLGWTPGHETETFDVRLDDPTAAAEPATFPRIPITTAEVLTTDPPRATFLRRLVPELRAHTASLLPDFMQPAAYVLVDSLPIGANGKIDTASLPDPDETVRRMSAGYLAPSTGTERMLAAVWSSVLGVDAVGLEDDFFADLGGNSLLATQVAARVRTRTDIDLPLRAVFEHARLGALAAELERLAADEGRDGVAQSRTAPKDADDTALVDVDELSDDEVDAMLLRLLGQQADGSERG
ncbi:amino acid adenylation domain-containing protein [Microbacterium sp. NPDC019599]|uniref:non-ribosomal peptide synthetase n=1 Tax=Microbacterium sp. NPDC019599 TaxID=3154690 RepID=UPI0033EEE446